MDWEVSAGTFACRLLAWCPALLVVAALPIGLSDSADAAPPRVAYACPDHGDAGVDPALTTLRIEFDQDMSTSGFSVCGSGDLFPKMSSRPTWESPRALVMKVSLEPAHEYRMSLNCPAARNTRSAAGEAAEITPIWFWTADAPNDGTAPPPQPAPPTPEQNRHAVEELRRAVDTIYSYRDRVVKDWDAIFNEHGPAMQRARSRAAFAREAGRMLAHAEDLHVTLAVGEGERSVRFATATRSVAPNVDANTLADAVPHWTDQGDGVFTGTTDRGIAFIAINEWTDKAATRAIDWLQSAKKSGTAKALVLDVRSNAGGDELAARRVAALFTEKSRVYSRNQYRDPSAPDGWGSVLDRTIEPAPAESRFATPVVVLMGRYCMSSCESFLLMLKGIDNITLVGTSSYGSSGNPRPTELSNGVAVYLSTWKDMLPDGTILEGHGVAPDVELSTEPGDFQYEDPLLNFALEELARQTR